VRTGPTKIPRLRVRVVMLPARGWFSNDKIARAKIHSISLPCAPCDIFHYVIRDGKLNAIETFLDRAKLCVFAESALVDLCCDDSQNIRLDLEFLFLFLLIVARISGSPDLAEEAELGRVASGNSINSPRRAYRLIISLYTRTRMTFSPRRGRNAAYDGSSS